MIVVRPGLRFRKRALNSNHVNEWMVTNETDVFGQFVCLSSHGGVALMSAYHIERWFFQGAVELAVDGVGPCSACSVCGRLTGGCCTIRRWDLTSVQ